MKKVTLSKIKKMLAVDDATVIWIEKMRHVTYPTGVKGRLGKVQVSAPGYQTRTMIIDQDSSGLTVR